MISSDQINKKINLFFQSDLAIIAIFFLLGLIGILNHAMWRDELQAWLLTQESNSLSELFAYLKYEGHPSLWFLCLKILMQFSHNPIIMQLFHLLLATGSIAIFVIFSPFTKLQKILFCFGHLPFYEYLLISRNYTIGILLIFIFCTLYEKRLKNYLLLSIILFLLAQANFYALLISITLGFILIVDYLLYQKQNLKFKNNFIILISSLLIFISGIIFCIITIIPSKEATYAGGLSGWLFQFDFIHLCKTLNLIWKSYFPIITPSKRILDTTFFAFISFFIFFFTSTLFRKKTITFLLYLTGTLGILTFSYVKFLGSPRHYCHLFILLIIVLWLEKSDNSSEILTKPMEKLFNTFNFYKKWLNFVDQNKVKFIMIILYIQLIVGVYLFTADLIIPMSAGKATANFIKQEKLDNLFIVGSKDFTMIPIAGYLNKKIYYPEIQRLSNFVSFTSERKEINDQDILNQLLSLINEHPKILLILNHPLEISNNKLKITTLEKFTKSRFSDERYYLYTVSNK